MATGQDALIPKQPSRRGFLRSLVVAGLAAVTKVYAPTLPTSVVELVKPPVYVPGDFRKFCFPIVRRCYPVAAFQEIYGDTSIPLFDPLN